MKSAQELLPTNKNYSLHFQFFLLAFILKNALKGKSLHLSVFNSFYHSHNIEGRSSICI